MNPLDENYQLYPDYSFVEYCWCGISVICNDITDYPPRCIDCKPKFRKKIVECTGCGDLIIRHTREKDAKCLWCKKERQRKRYERLTKKKKSVNKS